METAVRSNSVNLSDTAVLAARICGYGIDTPPDPGPPLTVYDLAFLPPQGIPHQGTESGEDMP